MTTPLNQYTHPILPEGTQVVTRVNKPIPNSDKFKKAGSVGIIDKSPADESYPYRIRFQDNTVLRFKRAELSIRREEARKDLVYQGRDLTQSIIYKCLVGSKAFGLATEDSDDDLRGIYLPEAELHWSIFKLPEQIELKEEEKDAIYWELEKYLNLALRANPNILETLWTPLVLYKNELAEELLSIRESFLSKFIYKTYSGYAMSQFEKMTRDIKNKGTYKPKHAMHLIRLYLSGIWVLKEGYLKVEVGEYRDELLRVKAGVYTFEEIKQWAYSLDEEFTATFEQTRLPDKPDYEKINNFLIKARRSMAK